LKVEVALSEPSEGCRRELVIEVPADEVTAEFEKTYNTYTRYAKVPGFRPGRVPKNIVRQRFGKEVSDEVLGHLVPHALESALVEQKLRVVGSPQISEITVHEGEPLRFKASVEILPEFTLQNYRGLQLTRRVARVTDEQIDAVLEDWQRNAGQMVPIEDRASEAGDHVSVNLVGKYVAPEEAEDLTAHDVVIELGAEGVQPEFDENLRGVRPGDERQFRVVYPEDFGAEGLAGKTLDFTATVIAVRREERPALDDEFAREFGEVEAMDELRARIRADLERNSALSAERQLRDEATTALLSGYEFAVPESMVEQQASELTRELAYTMLRGGVAPEQIRELNWEERMGEARLRAVRDIRAALVLGRIAEAEQIEVAGEEIDAEVARLAEGSRVGEEALRARLTKEGALSSIENRLRYQKTLDAIIKSAEVTDEEITDKPGAEEPSGPRAPEPTSDPS
jgi:trigger factor